jgi:hypothetical protein
MTTCVICGEYYRLNSWHSSTVHCQNCVDLQPINSRIDSDYKLEKDALLNPSGKTKAVFYDDYDREDSHGF